MVKCQAFLKKKPPLSPIYLVVGKEGFFRQEAIDHIIKGVEKAKGAEPFVMDLDGSSKLQGGDVVDELKTSSMFYSHKLVIVREAKKFMEDHGALLTTYLEQPSSSAWLILETPTFDGRLKLSQVLKKKGQWIQCEPLYHKPPPWQPHKAPYESDLCQWIVGRIKGKDKSISPQDGYIFIERLGGEVGKIAQAIDGFLLFIKDRKRVRSEDICQFLGVSKRSTSFEYLDCLMEKDLAGALDSLSDMFREGLPDARGDTIQAPAVFSTILISTIFRKFHQLWEALSLREKGLSFSEITSHLKINKFLFSKFKKEMGAFRKAQIPQILKGLSQGEMLLKSTQRPPREIMEALTIQICSRDRFLQDRFLKDKI